jgi:hypothetical protein
MDDVEVLISDRHGLDDTLERLQRIYGHDARFQFFAARDAIDWVAHYNWLLARGRGTYFAWMPHDDTFPAGFYSGLVEYLDANVATLLAFGPIIGVDEYEKELSWASHLRNPPPWTTHNIWTVRDAHRMLRLLPWEPMRGVFRREPVVRAGLMIRSTLDNQSADRGWLFGVGLRGAIRFVPVPPCVKRYHSASTHRTTMRRNFWSYSSLYPALACYVIRNSPTLLSILVGLGHVGWRYVTNVVLPRLKPRRA